MANTPITLDRFGGLDLRRDPTELGLSAASFAENVDFEGASQPRRRFGARVFNAVQPAAQYTATAAVGATPVAQTSSGPANPGTAADDASTGAAAWSDVNNAKTFDGTWALATTTDITGTHYLKLTNFGFAIPSDATVDGITVEVRKFGSSATQCFDEEARIVKGGSIGTTDRRLLPVWPTSPTYVTYGSSSDLWGESWTGADINSSGFGFALAANSSGLSQNFAVEHVRITVYYTPATSAGDVFSVRASGSDFIVDRLGLEEGEVLNSSAAFAGDAGGGGQSCRFAKLGTDAAGYVFVSPGNGNDAALMRWNGTAFSNSGYTGTSPVGACVAVTPWDNRLVNGGGADSPWSDKVIFSDEGDPLTFTADNFVLLHPGNSERIVEIVTWENFVIAFKQTEFFVFYGVSTDSSGGPVFEYRTVSGEGCSSSDGQKRHVAAGRDAVYFVNERGVFATRGGDPSLISEALNPLFLGGASMNPYADIERRAPDGLWYAHGLLYLAFEGTNTLYVYDERERWWSTYDMPGGETYDVAEDRITDSGRTLFALASPDIYEMKPSLTLDGAADEVQSVIATGGTAGTFTLTYSGQTTANINWDDTAAEIEAALEALSNIAVGDVYCYGGPLPNSKVYIKFIGTLTETDVAALTVGTENVTNGNATLAVERGGLAGVPIGCTWISGASDLGWDGEKVVKELYVTATDGTIVAALSDDLAAFPTGESNSFTDTQTKRYRGAATNVKARLFCLRLENSTASEAASVFSPQRVTLNLLGNRGGPQEGTS